MLHLPKQALTAPRALDRAAQALLYANEGASFDFAGPCGEPALAPPDSVSWRIFKNPVSLFIGGVAAVILELAEPAVRTGVWEHSSFRRDPVTRLRRTGLAAMVTVYGARSKAAAMIAGVVRVHDRVHGETPTGRAYGANDTDLLTWVQGTAAYGFLHAYDSYVQSLEPADHDRLYAEGAPAAALYGAHSAPRTQEAMQALLLRMAPRLEPHPIVFEFLELMRHEPLGPKFAYPLQRLLVRAAIDLVPRRVRERLGLLAADGLRPWERPIVTTIARSAERLMLPTSPPVQACLRLGLPADYLYR